ncbi:MAG: ATP-binding cassette domain-containing protein [Desulfobacterales bacterium]|nr:ATP-binding cassette domain-containing protein [Desulfobacterales bacterium]
MAAKLLETSNIKKYFGGLKVLQDVNISLDYGELLCILGPNGAGKTTFFNVISGTFKPTGGKVVFEGKNIAGLPIHKYARMGIMRKFQVPSIFDDLSVRENLAVAMIANRNSAPSNDRIMEVIDIIGLKTFIDTEAGNLAHGQKQWLEIGLAIITDPKLLLLDEPTAGMTADETAKTASLINSLRGQYAIIVIEHDMHFVRALNSYTIILHKGTNFREGSFSQIESDPEVKEIYMGRK